MRVLPRYFHRCEEAQGKLSLRAAIARSKEPRILRLTALLILQATPETRTRSAKDASNSSQIMTCSRKWS